MVWQGIHFLNVFSPVAISPATAAPAEDAIATIDIETLFIILRDPYSALPVLLALSLRLSRKLIRSEPSILCAHGPCVSNCRKPTPPKRDVKAPLVTAAQTTLTAFQRRNNDFRRIS